MKSTLLTTALAAGILFANASHAQTLYGITTSNSIFTMSNVNMPSSINGPYSITGVTSGQVLVGIDSRPSNGKLYALGYDSVARIGELYTITNSGTTYTATPVSGTLTSMDLGLTNNAAFDFVSSADNQVRVVGRNGNNYMLNADGGYIMSTGTSGLSYGVGDVFSGTSSLAATAYTNNFYGSDGTTQVGYDAANNVLVKMDAGSFSNGFNNASNITHSIGLGTGVVFATGGSVGMDTWYDTASHTNTVYMTGNTLLAGAHLYKYNLNSGAGGSVTDMGAIGSGSLNVRDIAFQTYRDSTSAVMGQMLTGLSLNLRNLIYFDSYNPQNIRRVVRLNGMSPNQAMVGIDYSSTGTLYGLGYNSASHTYQLYTIDSATGNVHAVNSTPLALNLGSDDGSGNRINAGFRFMATAPNRIRVMGNNGSVNNQIDASTGLIAATDTGMSYITGDANYGSTPNVTSIGYTGYAGDTTTQMFGFDANTGDMIMFDRNNSGTGYGSGTSGYISTGINLNSTLTLFAHNTTYNNSNLNIAYDNATNTNVGFITANYSGDSSDQQNYSLLYDMSAMLTGYHRGSTVYPAPIGRVGYGTPMKDIAIRRSGLSTTGFANITNGRGNDLLVYPNPVASTTHIVLPYASAGTVYVYIVDLNGNVDQIFQYGSGSTQLDVDMSYLPTGLYSVRVLGDGIADHNLKVIKN